MNERKTKSKVLLVMANVVISIVLSLVIFITFKTLL